MQSAKKVYSNAPCNVCGIPHRNDLHAAVLRVRGWFRDQVLMGLRAEELFRETTVEQRVEAARKARERYQASKHASTPSPASRQWAGISTPPWRSPF